MARATTQQGPTTAERVRSASARSGDAVLAIPASDPIQTALHHVRTCGDVVIGVPNDSRVLALAWQAGHGGLPAVLELTDLAPLPLRERVRSLVWLRGTVHPVPASAERALAAEVAAESPQEALLDVGHSLSLVRLRLSSAVVADSSGAEPVDVDELRLAGPDPFWQLEGAWLQHLADDHPDVIDLLARRLPPLLRRGRVRPLAIDRYGITLRVELADGDRDVRLSFNEPVSDFPALTKAVRVLVGCPFLNGLRSRS